MEKENKNTLKLNDWKLTSPKFCRMSSTTLRALLSSGAAMFTVLHNNKKRDTKREKKEKDNNSINQIFKRTAQKLLALHF